MKFSKQFEESVIADCFGIDFGTTNSFGRDKLEQRNAFTSVVHGLGSSVPLFV